MGTGAGDQEQQSEDTPLGLDGPAKRYGSGDQARLRVVDQKNEVNGRHIYF